MATRRVATRGDDLDGRPGAHTVRFGLDGRAYEIDLTEAHARQFREVLAPYVSAGRRLTSSGRPYIRHRPRHQNHRGRDGEFAVGAADQPDGANAIICR